MLRSKYANDDALDLSRSPHRTEDGFLPNPEIPPSPSSTPPKKIWEGAYRNFLSRGKSNSPKGSRLSKSPPDVISKSPQDGKKSTFSVLPGSKRLVTRGMQFPSSAPNHRSTVNMSMEEMPSMPSIAQKDLSDNLERRTQSMLDLGAQNPNSYGDAGSPGRGGKLLRSVFGRNGEGSSLHRRSRSKFGSADGLDSAIHNGIGRNSPEYANLHRPPPPIFPSKENLNMPSNPLSNRKTRTSSLEDVPSGLDALLSASSSSPHLTVEVAGYSRTTSYGVMSTSSNSDLIQPQLIDRVSSVGSFNYSQAGLLIDDDESSKNSPKFAMENFMQHPRVVEGNGKTEPASLLSQQVELHLSHRIPSPSTTVSSEQGSLPNTESAVQPTIESHGNSHSSSMHLQYHSHHQSQQQQNPYLQQPLSVYQHQQYEPVHEQSRTAVGPEMKKAFTNFHNQAQYARDSTSAFLGGESPGSLDHHSYVAYNMALAGNRGASMPHFGYYDIAGRDMGNYGSSLQLHRVDENDISIKSSMRLLKPIQGTDSWEKGRRYLIAPAAMAACPLAVVNRFSGCPPQEMPQAVRSFHDVEFGIMELGNCLMTYVGEKHHLSLGKWSSCRLVLRQNYLFEYSSDVPTSGVPRGYANLQYAKAIPHTDFQDSFELDFYASPCAKADRRILLIRATREERDHWVACINRAAELRIEDIWELDAEIQIGNGRYASVYPARRRQKTMDGEQQGAIESSNRERKTCALKIVDKKEFWRRVVKGIERPDTLVRELSVQATLTAKCPKIGTFLQLRGFFENSENVVLELELLEGTDLFGYVSSKGHLSEDEAAIIMQDMLASLDAMNRVGLAHRDIKPANILMCNREIDGVSVKVGDFGMSTFVGVDGLVRGRCGTPGYVAPEILTAESHVGYSNKVDIFSAGVTLYVMLCGYEPFYGENEKDLIDANKEGMIDFPESDWAKVSDQAKDLVMKMTQVDPQDRITIKQAMEHPWFENHRNETSKHGTAIPSADTPAVGLCTIS